MNCLVIRSLSIENSNRSVGRIPRLESGSTDSLRTFAADVFLMRFRSRPLERAGWYSGLESFCSHQSWPKRTLTRVQVMDHLESGSLKQTPIFENTGVGIEAVSTCSSLASGRAAGAASILVSTALGKSNEMTFLTDLKTGILETFSFNLGRSKS